MIANLDDFQTLHIGLCKKWRRMINKLKLFETDDSKYDTRLDGAFDDGHHVVYSWISAFVEHVQGQMPFKRE